MVEPTSAAGSATLHGPLWGRRARDWASIQEAMTRPVYEAVLERAAVGPDTAYLDLGCGSGMAARIAADRGARVTGLDAASALLEIARERTPDGDFREGDIASLPFDDGAFDVVTGFSVFPYADEPVGALREARRVAKPEGIVAVSVWGDLLGMPAAAVISAVGPLLPPQSLQRRGPFALSEPSVLLQEVTDAGLRPFADFTVACAFAYPDQATAVRGLNSAGVAVRAIEHSGEEQVSKAHIRALTPFRRADGSYHVPASVRVLMTRPA